SRTTPVAIAILPKVLDIDTGGGHVCAHIEDGVMCWGQKVEGEVGNGRAGVSCGSNVCTPAPTRVESLAAIRRVSLGFHLTVAVAASGLACAWGWCGTRTR